MGYKILIADNNPDSLNNLSTILKENTDEEYTIDTVIYEEELFDKISSFNPGLMILHLQEKAFSSIEIIQSLKSLGQTRNTPILLIAESVQSQPIERAFEMGIFDVIYEPINKEEFILRVKALVSKNNYFQKFLVQAKHIEQISNIASKSSNAVAIISPVGRIEWVNEGFTKMYESSFKEFKKQFEDTLFNPEVNQNFKKALNQSVNDKENVVYENKWTTPSGKEKWIHTTLTPVFDDVTGEITNIIAIESDVTKLKETENKLEDQNKYLLKFTRHLETTNEILEKQRGELEKEQKKSEELLLNILPYPVARQLMTKGYSNLRTFKLVTVMFTDFKGFTKLSETLNVQQLIRQLSDYFEKFDEITNNHYIEKIKTIGDSYMCAGGLPLRNRSNPIDLVLAGLEIQDFVREKLDKQKKNGDPPWELRLGIHSGEVIAGVIGKKKFAYDIWGDCVNIASRMEVSSEVGKVNISGVTYEHIKSFFDCTYRGKINVKYKGEMEMYYVNRLLPQYSKDKNGIFPNEKFKKILSSY